MIHTTNFENQLNKELLLQDYDVSEIAKYKYLNNEYGLSVQLYSYQNSYKLDKATFLNNLPNNVSKQKCNTQTSRALICEDATGDYYGYIPVEIENKILGYIQTEKRYPKHILNNSPTWFFYITFGAILGVLLINFLLISLSVKKYIRINLNNLLKSIHGEAGLDGFTTKEHYEIAYALSTERENNKKLQTKITQQEVEQALNDIVRQVTHNIRSPLTTLQVICRNSLSKLSHQDNKQFRSAINDISGLINNLILKTTKHQLEDDKNNLPRYVNIYSSISTSIGSKLTELGDSMCNLQITPESIAVENTWIYIAPSKFNSVISNLLNNAYEAIQNLEKNIKINIRTLERNLVEIVIEDNGVGIPQSKIEAVKAGLSLKKDGCGIGLSSSIEYIESIGGSLDLEPAAVGEGTKVIINIPIYHPPFLIESFELDMEKTLIIVDDDTAIHRYWRKFTKQNSIKALHFTDPESFIYWFSSCHNAIDYYYLVDYYYANSKLTGIDIVSKLKDLNVLLITNDYDSLIVQEYCVEHRIPIIPKPHLKDLIIKPTHQ
jgi:signal transduction histidine kinase